MTKKEHARLVRDILTEEARKIVAAGICPTCRTRLVRNNALAGWWQCGAYACEQMRKPEFAGLPQCNFQIFTE